MMDRELDLIEKELGDAEYQLQRFLHCRAVRMRAEGRAEVKVSVAMNLIKSDKYSFDEIADVTELPLETIQELAKENATT